MLSLTTTTAFFGGGCVRHFRTVVAPRLGLNFIKIGRRYFAYAEDVDRAQKLMFARAGKDSDQG